MTDLFIIACYFAGTIFGLYVGYTAGVRKGAGVMLETLVANNFVKHKIKRGGEIELLPLNEEVTEQ